MKRLRTLWNKTLIFLKSLLSIKFAICFFVAWMITNGWSYIFVVVGKMLNIKWMLAVGSAYLAFLWLPFTPEKIVTISIALFLNRIIFKNDDSNKEKLKMLKAKMNDNNGV